MKLTRAQRTALYSVYQRKLLVFELGQTRPYIQNEGYYLGRHPLTYRQFRRTIKPGWDCIMVPYCGQWLGIETDGYTHS